MFQNWQYELLNACLNFTGAFGVILIIYGYISHQTKEHWKPLEQIALYVSPIITLLGVIALALSIYIPNNPRPPFEVSKMITAPVIIIVSLLAFIYLVKNKWVVSEYFIQGFAIFALSGSLIRVLVK